MDIVHSPESRTKFQTLGSIWSSTSLSTHLSLKKVNVLPRSWGGLLQVLFLENKGFFLRYVYLQNFPFFNLRLKQNLKYILVQVYKRLVLSERQ